ncbi:hypothetical protein BJ508DRAFT_201829, partial [Ascobolus immersus RN42]
HFFWISGTADQRSLEGLYRSILAQIFESEPKLLLRAVDRQAIRKKRPQDWNKDDFDFLLRRTAEVISLSADINAKLAIFIDGLDEYDIRISADGHELDVVNIVKSLADSDFVKICVSSRPWTIFKRALEHHGCHVAVHDFTFSDMQKYSLDGLKSLASFQIALKSDTRWESLSTEIAVRSEGVWLWTDLVCKNVFREVADGESYERVQQRLEEIPQDLDTYFKELVERSDERYKGEGARILLMAL